MSYAEEHYEWADETDYQPSKRKEHHMQTITIGAVTKESKFFNDETIWGVKVGNSWMDLHVPDKPTKEQTLTVETWTVESKGKTYVHARPVAEQPAQAPRATPGATPPARPTQTFNGNRATSYTQAFEAYSEIARKAHALATELEPAADAARARFGFVSTFLIAFGDGKMLVEPDDEWGTTAPSQNQPVKHEKTAAHIHLEKVIWNYCERTGKTAADCSAMFKEVSGKNDMLELSEKEAILARLKAETIIDAATDYKTLFTEAAKARAKKEGWELAGKDAASVKKKQDLLFQAGITKSFKDVTNLEAKAALEILTDNAPF